MSVKVVARIRPLLGSEPVHDTILITHAAPSDKLDTKSIVKIPNPKIQSELYSFHFQSVYGQDATQQELFDAEIAPTVKHLFAGFDVTLFAYGVTGTGKTHTMRGGKSLADRGMIPRMLSSIFRKGKSIEKKAQDTGEEMTVEVTMSYYEIYNDKVFDLFQPPETRTPTGLPIREAEGGKTVVAGLSEVLCNSLKEFETLYDKANANRSVGATKLNAQSSRSHAILCVKVTTSTPTEVRSSSISAIDLAGSEDNRRTGNAKERMVESASINKSLFVLAQCVEAISKKQSRIPYRESKMTRILSLGQNNGLTVMILNLAPTKAYHLDTLSSLNFANRTKKIEVREIENEAIFKAPPKPKDLNENKTGAMVRQPLRPISTTSSNILANKDVNVRIEGKEKPAKLFSVYADHKAQTHVRKPSTVSQPLKSSPLKRTATEANLSSDQSRKQHRPTPSTSFLKRGPPETTTITKASLESLVEKKVAEILAQRDAQTAANQSLPSTEPLPKSQAQPIPNVVDQTEEISSRISASVQARLDRIEKRLQTQEGERAEGLSYLLMAKQAQAKGEDMEALDYYLRAREYFPENEKLGRKIDKLRSKGGKSRIIKKQEAKDRDENESGQTMASSESRKRQDRSERDRGIGNRKRKDEFEDNQEEEWDQQRERHRNSADEEQDELEAETSYHQPDSSDDNRSQSDSEDDLNTRHRRPKSKSKSKSRSKSLQKPIKEVAAAAAATSTQIPTTLTQDALINLLNSGDLMRLRSVPSMGAKKIEAIADALSARHDNGMDELQCWDDVLALNVKGIGKGTWLKIVGRDDA